MLSKFAFLFVFLHTLNVVCATSVDQINAIFISHGYEIEGLNLTTLQKCNIMLNMEITYVNGTTFLTSYDAPDHAVVLAKFSNDRETSYTNRFDDAIFGNKIEVNDKTTKMSNVYNNLNDEVCLELLNQKFNPLGSSENLQGASDGPLEQTLDKRGSKCKNFNDCGPFYQHCDTMGSGQGPDRLRCTCSIYTVKSGRYSYTDSTCITLYKESTFDYKPWNLDGGGLTYLIDRVLEVFINGYSYNPGSGTV